MNKKLFLIIPVICGIFWGSGGVFTRVLNDFGMNSLTIFTARVTLACLMLFLFLIIFDRESLKINLKDLWIFIGSGILGVFMLNMCYNEAAFRVSLSLASLLLSLAPIFALIISAILFKEEITKIKLVCLVVALFGSFLVSGYLDGGSTVFSPFGILCGFLSALFWALFGMFSKIASNRGYSSFTITFYSFLIISIAIIPFADWGIFAEYLTTNSSFNVPFAIANALFVGVLPYILFNISLSHIDNGLATILCSGGEPLSATIFGVLLYSEYPTFLNFIGIIITLIALSVLINSNDEDNV